MKDMPKDFRQLVRRLEKEGVVVGRANGRKHSFLLLAGGAKYPVPCTPSVWRSLANTEAHIKRLTRIEAPGYYRSTLKRNGLPKD
jgi:hypothetical protein